MDRHARASGSQGYVQHYFHGRATDFYSWSILLQSRKSTGSGIRSPCESVFALKEMALTGRAGKGQGQSIFVLKMLPESSGARLRRGAGAAAVHLRRIGPEYGVLAGRYFQEQNVLMGE